LGFVPQSIKLEPEGLVTLQHWLAARYHRAAFAEEFERRLKNKSGKLDRKLAKAMDGAGAHILAVLFDVDGSQELERKCPVDVYKLRITILYDSSLDEPAAYEAAQKAADSVEAIFEAALVRGWQVARHPSFVLRGCFRQRHDSGTKQTDEAWRLDYMSLADDP